MSGSLRDIFDHFISLGFDKDLAWHRAIRHKFGFIDTRRPGDIIKPAMYFYWAQKIRKLDKDIIIRLFNGKIDIEYAKEEKKYRGKIPKEKIVEFFELY